jgi:uncharacterized protein YjlB
MLKPRIIELKETDSVPNNPALPVLIYEAAMENAGDVAAAMEQAFQENDWPPQWRNGIYDYDHYHSTAHETLGIARGEAILLVGGDGGEEVPLFAGDVIILPAGTGHKRLSASEDFLVVGAYPAGQNWDLISANERAKKPEAQKRIAKVPLPDKDPILGGRGPLMHLWKQIGNR